MNTLKVTTNLVTSINLIRLIDNQLIPSACTITNTFTISPDIDTDDVKMRIHAMRTWISDYVNYSVAYSVDADIDTKMLEELDNNLMMCPDEPHDYLLALLIHAKLTSLAGEALIVENTKFESDNADGLSQIVTGSALEVLPDMQTWIGPRHFHTTPWWGRTDSSCIDMIPENHEDLKKIPELGKNLLNVNVQNISDQTVKMPVKLRIITNDD
jgi:hypothetical protein